MTPKGHAPGCVTNRPWMSLYVGLEDGVDTLYHISEPRDALLMMPRDVVEYVQGLRYFVGMSEQKAINLFREKLAEMGS